MRVLSFLVSSIMVINCFFLIFVVLIQKGEGGGLGGLAGGTAVDTAFGAKADMTWKRATAISATLFILLSLTLAVLERPKSVTKSALNPPAPPQAPAVPNPPAHVGS
jgi:preprotein translocase subunit SecG